MAFDVAGFKKTFFDRAAVASKIPPAIRKALTKFGAYTRQKAKKSLKYGDKPSRPGMPPTVHRSKRFTRKKKVKGKQVVQPSSPLRELIFFGYEPSKESVVIGPALGGSRTGAPESLEHGGAATVTSASGQTKRVSIAPRPFMQPAFEQQLQSVAGNFTNLVK